MWVLGGHKHLPIKYPYYSNMLCRGVCVCVCECLYSLPDLDCKLLWEWCCSLSQLLRVPWLLSFHFLHLSSHQFPIFSLHLLFSFSFNWAFMGGLKKCFAASRLLALSVQNAFGIHISVSPFLTLPSLNLLKE